MQSWPSPSLPRLPGRGIVPSVHDTASGARVQAAVASTATLYVCGITPYDSTHLGHAATYVAFDTLIRALRDADVAVRYCQNITDVDDPLLVRATETGNDWRAIATEGIDVFRADMQALRVVAPDAYIGAVEAIPRVIHLIERLDAAGFVYRIEDDFYFDATRAPGFGDISGYDRETMLTLSAERGGDPQRPGKRDPLDPLVWMAERPGEPSWPSSLGQGRPGWHIECAAISLEYLGPTIDIQGGGADLIFPHHELSGAQAAAAVGEDRYARVTMHTGMVGLDGIKMSKSLGNLVFVSRLRADGVDPRAIRLALLAHHYRSDWSWTASDLTAATQRLTRWQAAAARSEAADPRKLIAQLRSAIADDLNTPAALDYMDAWAEREGEQREAADVVVDAVDALLGIRLDAVSD